MNKEAERYRNWRSELDNKSKILFLLFSVIGGGAIIAGKLLSDNGTLRNASYADALTFIIAVCCLFGFNTYVAMLIDKRQNKAISPQGTDLFSWKKVLCWSAIIFILWIPFFLSYYPTLWNYDIAGEVPEIIGGEYSNHHPILHQLYVQAIIKLSLELTGYYELGMVLLSLFQMIMMSFAFGYSIEIVRTWNRKKWLTIVLLLFYGVMLFNPILSLSQTKDIPYTFCFIIIFLTVIRQVDKGLSLKQLILVDIFAVIFMLNRKNGMFALVFWAIMATLLLIRDNQKSLIELIWFNIVLSSVAFLVINSSLVRAYDASPANPKMAFVVPFQCLTNIAAHHPEVVPEYGTGGELFGVINRDLLPADLNVAYKYNWGWPVLKSWAAQPQEDFDAVKLVEAWIINGIKYPVDTIDGWGKLLLGTWYPFDTSHARIYEGPEFERQGYLLTDFKKFSIFTERPASKLPKFESFLELFATDSVHQKMPIVSLLFAPASYIWCVFFVIMYSLYKRKRKELIIALLLIGQYITVLLGPSMPVRYMWPIMVTAPILLSRLTIKEK